MKIDECINESFDNTVIEIKSPSALTDEQFTMVCDLIKMGNEVPAHRVETGVLNCYKIAFAMVNDEIVACGAIKIPKSSI